MPKKSIVQRPPVPKKRKQYLGFRLSEEEVRFLLWHTAGFTSDEYFGHNEPQFESYNRISAKLAAQFERRLATLVLNDPRLAAGFGMTGAIEALNDNDKSFQQVAKRGMQKHKESFKNLAE
jgi:hypothetical protein